MRRYRQPPKLHLQPGRSLGEAASLRLVVLAEGDAIKVRPFLSASKSGRLWQARRLLDLSARRRGHRQGRSCFGLVCTPSASRSPGRATGLAANRRGRSRTQKHWT